MPVLDSPSTRASASQNNLWKADFFLFLKEEFHKLRAADPAFSMIKMAKRAGLSPGVLSDILSSKSKWNISPLRAIEILSRLEIAAGEKSRWRARMGLETDLLISALSAQDYDILENWRVYPILFSLDLPPPLNGRAQIAHRLGLEEKEVQAVLEDLQSRNLILQGADGFYRRTNEVLGISDEGSDHTVRKFYETSLSQAKEALRKTELHERDFSTFTFAGDASQIALVKSEIRALLAKAAALMNTEKKTDVFKISVQLFPVRSPADGTAEIT